MKINGFDNPFLVSLLSYGIPNVHWGDWGTIYM